MTFPKLLQNNPSPSLPNLSHQDTFCAPKSCDDIYIFAVDLNICHSETQEVPPPWSDCPGCRPTPPSTLGPGDAPLAPTNLVGTPSSAVPDGRSYTAGVCVKQVPSLGSTHILFFPNPGPFHPPFESVWDVAGGGLEPPVPSPTLPGDLYPQVSEGPGVGGP